MDIFLPHQDNISIMVLFLPVMFLYLFLCLNKPWWIITGLAIYLPFEEFVLKWTPDFLYVPLRYLGESTIIFLFAVYAIDKVFVKKRWVGTPIDTPVLMLLGTIIFSGVINHVPIGVAVLGLKNLWRYVFLFYLIILLKPPEKHIFILLKILFVVAIVQACIAFAQTIVGKPAYEFFAAKDVVIGGQIIRSGVAAKLASGTYHTMVFGTMGRYNILGNYLAMWLGIMLAMFLSKSNVLRIKLWHIVLFVGAMVLSYSRMSWISFLVGSIILFLLSKKNKYLAYISILLLVVFTFLGMLITRDGIDTSAIDVGMGSPFSRYLDIFSSDYLTISLRSGRGYSYLSIVPAVLKINPLWGLGPGMIASNVSRLMDIDTSLAVAQLQIDNPYALRYLGDAGFATIIAQIGLVGLVAVVLIFIQLLRCGFSLFRNVNTVWHFLALGYISLTVMMAIFNFASFALIYRIPSFYFWMFSAFIVLQNTRDKKARYVSHRQLITSRLMMTNTRSI